MLARKSFYKGNQKQTKPTGHSQGKLKWEQKVQGKQTPTTKQTNKRTNEIQEEERTNEPTRYKTLQEKRHTVREKSPQ